MKKYLLIAFLFSLAACHETKKSATRKSVFFADTTAANLNDIRKYPGAQIFITSDTSIWIRNDAATQWIKQTCDFGMQPQEFNTVARVLPPEEIATKKKPPTTTQPPPPVSLQQGVLFFDFDGQAVSNTSWNYNGDIVCANAGMTAAEQQQIIDTIKKWYSVFPTVIVTDDERVYNAANPYKRMRCIATQTNEWYGTGNGGVSFIGSFTWGDNTPCFVFSKLLNYNIRLIALSAAHECGHTFGLLHQSSYDSLCRLTGQYNKGGNGRAPIMGWGPAQASQSWWIGPNPYSCATVQNDTLNIKNALK